MHSRILLGLALAAQPLALGAQSLPLVLDDIACPPGTSVTLALPDVTDTRSSSSEIPPGIQRPWAEFSFDNNILGATLDLTWRDQGWGFKKGRVEVEQKDHTGSVLAEEGFGLDPGPRPPVGKPSWSPWVTESHPLAYAPEWTDVAKFYRVGGGGGHKLQITDATLTVNCGTLMPTPAPTSCVECSPSAECPSGFDCDYTSGPSGGRKLRFGSLETGCCRVV